MTKHPFLTFLMAMALPCHAQDITNTANNWQQYFAQISDYDDIENDNLENFYEQLNELSMSPINLNTATDDDLKLLTFLNATQLEELTEYLDRYRPLRSIGELSMIKSLDPLRIKLLQCFVYVGDEPKKDVFPSFKDLLKYGKNELVAAARIPFYTREGDRNGYLGYRYKHWFRYSFKCGQRLQVGITGTQDAGEPFFSNANSLGYDHYSYYAVVRQLGVLKALALGQYKLRFGAGLVMNTGFTLGKTSSLLMSTPANVITANTSRSDAYYLQGAAATISLGQHVEMTAFASYRKIDATLNDDGSIKTILRTGYHRTISEMERKHNASQATTGGNIKWRNHGFDLGASLVYTTFDRDLSPDVSKTFRHIYPTGKSFMNGSINYGFTSHLINIKGETAINNDGAIATLNSIIWKTSKQLSLSAIQRFYSYRYFSLFSSAFSDGGEVQNESGMYVGASWTPAPRLSILAYSDYAYFPWPRYGVSTSSHSWDNLLQASYTFSKSLALSARYRLRIREEDNMPSDGSQTQTIDKTEHRMRLALAYSATKFNTKTLIDMAYVTFPAKASDKSNSLGWMISQAAGYNHRLFNVTANIGYFKTHDYNSRIYMYERNTLYNFSFPMFYGEGMRAALFASTTPCANVTVIGKIGTTKYFDRDHISSSYQQINKSMQTDLDLQVKWKF